MNENFKKHYYDKFFKNSEKIKITKKQEELIRLLAKGFTIKEIADILNLSYYNIQKRTQILHKKFNVHKRHQLIDAAIKNCIIRYADLTSRYRKRFVKFEFTVPKVTITEPLTEQELEYLKLLAKGETKKNILKEMKLLNMNFCNYIQNNICKKLNAKNRVQAVFFACILKLI